MTNNVCLNSARGAHTQSQGGGRAHLLRKGQAGGADVNDRETQAQKERTAEETKGWGLTVTS